MADLHACNAAIPAASTVINNLFTWKVEFSIFPDNSIEPLLTRTVFGLPSELELLRFYCSNMHELGLSTVLINISLLH